MSIINCSSSPTVTRSRSAREAGRRLSLILPAHNEEPVIQQAIEEAVAALSALALDEYEVIVVDDGSTDDTRRVAEAAAAPFPQVRIHSLAKNAGYSEALRTGFRIARFELVAFTDADCQFDLRELDRLLALTDTADVVCGIRVDRQDPWRRKVYSRGFNVLARTLLGTQVRDCDCALKIFRRDWVNSAGLEAQGFFFNAELLCRARQAGLKIAEIGVTHRPRSAGTSKVSITHVIPVLRTLLRFWWSQVLLSRPKETDDRHEPGWQTGVASLLLAVIAALVLLPRISYPLLDPDETRYAEIAREMLDSGDFLVPTRRGEPYLDKPPLLYWLTVASYMAFGTTAGAARLVTTLAAMGTVLSTYWFGRGMIGRRAAWVGAFLQLACVGFVLSGRFLFMDSLLTLFTTISLLAGYSAIRGPTFRPGMWILAAVACGLGALTKGPVAGALCVPPLAAAAWLTTGTSRLTVRRWIGYATIVAAIALPWFVAISLRQPDFTGEFVLTHHFERFFSGLSHEEPFWFYGPVLLIAMMPCAILFPATYLCLSQRGPRGREIRTWDVGYLLFFAFWTLALFTISECKLPPYILPALPPLCMVIGVALCAIVNDAPAGSFLNYVRERSPRDLSVIMLLAVPVVAGIDWLLLGDGVFARSTQYVILSIAGISLIALLTSNLIPKGYPRWVLAAAYALATLNFGVGDFTPAIAVQRCKVPEVLRLCGKGFPSPNPIVCVSLAQEIDGFSFYMPGQSLRSFESGEMDGAIAALTDIPSSLVFAHVEILDELKAKFPPSMQWDEIGRHEHIVIGMTSPGTSTAATPSSIGVVPHGPAAVAGRNVRSEVLGELNLSDTDGSVPPADLHEGWSVASP